MIQVADDVAEIARRVKQIQTGTTTKKAAAEPERPEHAPPPRIRLDVYDDMSVCA